EVTRSVLAPISSGTSTQKLPSGSTRATTFFAPPVWTTTVDPPGAVPRRAALSRGVVSGPAAAGGFSLMPPPWFPLPPASGRSLNLGGSAPHAAARQIQTNDRRLERS